MQHLFDNDNVQYVVIPLLPYGYITVYICDIETSLFGQLILSKRNRRLCERHLTNTNNGVLVKEFGLLNFHL